MRIVLVQQLALRCLNSGPLQPWLGPAVRGAVAKPWKSAVCRLTKDEQSRLKDPNHCLGCAHHDSCDYGRTVEPHAAGKTNQSGSTLVVFAPQFPSAPDGMAAQGTIVPFNLVLIGPAIESRETILNTLSASLRQGGLGDDHPVKCELIRDAQRLSNYDLLPGDLPAGPSANVTTVPRVRIRLLSPLLLKQGWQQGEKFADGKRRPNHRPHLVDLLSPSIGLINQLFDQLGETSPLDANSATLLKRATDHCSPIKEEFEPFFQVTTSKRRDVYRADGILGEAVYTDVPSAIIPWLVWGGRLHVGSHRVAGAGGWQVILE